MFQIGMRAIYMFFAAMLFFVAVAQADTPRADIVKASIVIGLCLGGSVALVMAGIIKEK
jgi:hypothetical protein